MRLIGCFFVDMDQEQRADGVSFTFASRSRSRFPACDRPTNGCSRLASRSWWLGIVSRIGSGPARQALTQSAASRLCCRERSTHGGTDAAAAGDLVARDQHLLARADEAGTLLPRRHDAAERPGGDRLLSRDRHVHGRLPGGGGRDRRRGGGAGVRQRAAEWTGGRRRLRDVLPHDHRRGGAGRLRCAVARPARRDGHRPVRRRRGRTAAPHPRHRSDHADVRRLRHARQLLRRDGEQRAGRHRLPDLSAHRSARRPPNARRARCCG